MLLLFKSGKISLVFNKQKMSPNESPELRLRRHRHEAYRRVVAMSALAAVVVTVVVKYIPNNLTSEHVKPPTTTEQTYESERTGNITSQNAHRTQDLCNI